MAGKILWVLQYDVHLSCSVMTTACEGCLVVGRMSSQVDEKTNLRTEFASAYHYNHLPKAILLTLRFAKCICINAKINLQLTLFCWR